MLFPRPAFVLQNVLHLHQQRWVIPGVDSLALWKIINEEDAVLIPKTRGDCFSSEFFHSEYFLGAVSHYATTPLIVISPGHIDVTRFRPWWPIAKANHLDRAKINAESCSDDWHRWRFRSAFRHFGTHFAVCFRISKSSRMVDPARSHNMPSCSTIDLSEMRRSSNISSWIWSIISGEANVLGRPGRGASQVIKSPRLILAIQFLTLAYDRAWSLVFRGQCRLCVRKEITTISFHALNNSPYELIMHLECFYSLTHIWVWTVWLEVRLCVSTSFLESHNIWHHHRRATSCLIIKILLSVSIRCQTRLLYKPPIICK